MRARVRALSCAAAVASLAAAACDAPKPAVRPRAGSAPSPAAAASPADAAASAAAVPAPVPGADTAAEPGEPPDVSGLPVPPIGEKAKPGPVRGVPTGVAFLSPLERWGWAKDGKTFFYCVPNNGPGDCWRVPVDGKAQRVKSVPSELGKGAATWPYGDIEITSELEAPAVHVGGRIGSGRGRPNVYSFRFDGELETGGDYGLEVVSVSPDGTHIVFLVHGELGESFIEVEHKLDSTRAFAAAVYSATGFNHLREDDFDRAAHWFSRAAATGDHWKHPYNLACARARGKLPGVETALRNAVARGGEPAKAKARRDLDLIDLRDQPWFIDLVGKVE